MNTIRRGIALLFKTVFFALLAAILTPVLYFAWRAGQPMDLPQLRGMSYYQYLEMRKICGDYLLNQYETNHQDALLSNQDMTKYRISSFTPIGLFFLLTGYTTFGYLSPDLDPENPWVSGLHLDTFQNRLRQNPWLTLGPVTWFNFLPSWWQMSEAAIWHAYQVSDFSNVPASCGKPLTPEEFRAVKNSWETAKTIP